MQLGCLATVAALKPANLTMVIMDNGLYQITGGQKTPAAGTADYSAEDPESILCIPRVI